MFKKFIFSLTLLVSITIPAISQETLKDTFLNSNSNIQITHDIRNDYYPYDLFESKFEDLDLIIEKNKYSLDAGYLEEEITNSGSSGSDSSSSTILPGLNTVSCYWVNTTTLDVWDLSPLKRKDDEDEKYISTPDGKIAYNFCGNIKAECGNSEKSQAALLKGDTDVCYKRLAGDSGKFNLWKMRNDKNITEGVVIYTNYGEKFGSTDNNYTVIWDLKCNDKLKDGELQITDITGARPLLSYAVKISAETKHGK